MNKDLDELVSAMQQIGRFIYSNNKKKIWIREKGTPLQFFTLRFLMDNPQSSISDITKRFQITKSSGTQLIDRLQKQGLIGKKTDRKDKRIVHLNLTAKAVRISKKMKKERDEQMKKIFSKVSTKDLRELIRINLSLLKSLQEEKTHI